jgi:hypothetical protein
MKMTETTLSIGRTINLGNFESLRVDLSIRAEINSDNYSEDLKSIERVLTENLEAVVSRQLSEPSHESSEEEFI